MATIPAKNRCCLSWSPQHCPPPRHRHQRAACRELRKSSAWAPTRMISPESRQSEARKAPVTLPSQRVKIIKISLYLCTKPTDDDKVCCRLYSDLGRWLLLLPF